MRRRLLTSTLTIVIATVALFGIPLAFVLDRVVHDEAQSQLDRDATRVARELGKGDTLEHAPAVLASELQRLVPSDDRVVVHWPGGRTLATREPEHATLLATAVGPNDTEVSVEAPVGDVDARVAGALLVVGLVAAVALGGALLLSFVQSAQLARPLARLARSANRLGIGDFSLSTPRSGVQEIDDIAEALDRSAARIDRLLLAERSFSAHASHQLRSALTGLQLRIEELLTSSDPQVREEAEAALEQSTRLNTTIDDLLALARTGRPGIVTLFDLADLVRQHTDDVRPILARQGRQIVVDAAQDVPAVAAVGAIGQVVDILLSNAARHGHGTIKVQVNADERRARIDIEDDGPGIDPAAVATLFESHLRPDGHGIGLALARTLITTEGGTIVLARARPPLFRVELPRA
jgi:signal transduction histidine kinase